MSKKKSWEFEDAEGTEKPEGWYEYRDACILDEGMSEDEANRAADEEFGCDED